MHDIGKEGVIVGAAAAFSGKAGFRRIVLENIERHMTDNHYILGRRIQLCQLNFFMRLPWHEIQGSDSQTDSFRSPTVGAPAVDTRYVLR